MISSVSDLWFCKFAISVIFCSREMLYATSLFLLVNICYGSTVHRPPMSDFRGNTISSFGRFHAGERFLPSWVPVRPSTVGKVINVEDEDDSEVWPSLISNLWQKTEIALFVPSFSSNSKFAKSNLDRIQRISLPFSRLVSLSTPVHLRTKPFSFFHY